MIFSVGVSLSSSMRTKGGREGISSHTRAIVVLQKTSFGFAVLHTRLTISVRESFRLASRGSAVHLISSQNCRPLKNPRILSFVPDLSFRRGYPRVIWPVELEPTFFASSRSYVIPLSFLENQTHHPHLHPPRDFIEIPMLPVDTKCSNRCSVGHTCLYQTVVSIDLGI